MYAQEVTLIIQILILCHIMAELSCFLARILLILLNYGWHVAFLPKKIEQNSDQKSS
jgi:hypothetical protein